MRLPLNINKIIPKKSLGQNFIIDKNFINKLNNLITVNEKTTIIEIGPGKGALTDALLEKNFRKLFLIEKDNNLHKFLSKKYKLHENITIINKDALELNYAKFHNEPNVVIIGNLPFNVSTQLLFKWLEEKEWPPFYSKMILMFQKEVADRIISKHDSKNYGRISVAAQARCEIKKLINAPSKIFHPIPKVSGTILEFYPSLKFKEMNFFILQKILKLAFQQRRKKIKTNLAEYDKILKKLDINQDLRAENLSVVDYCNLAINA